MMLPFARVRWPASWHGAYRSTRLGAFSTDAAGDLAAALRVGRILAGMDIDTAPQWTLRDVVVVCGAALAAYVAAALAVAAWAAAVGDATTDREPLLEAPALALSLAAVVWLAARRRPGPGLGLDLVTPPRRWWAYGAALYLAYAGALMALGVLVTVGLGLPVQGFAPRWGEVGLGAVGRAVLLAVVLGPLLEEMVFRGVLQKALTQRFGIRVALPVAAVLFALIHLPAVGLPHLTAGFLYGWAYHRSGSLWIAVALHSLDNAVTIVLRAALSGHV